VRIHAGTAVICGMVFALQGSLANAKALENSLAQEVLAKL
jgi:hypothetical protein